MTHRQKLMLFLISADPGIRSVFDMQRLYDRTDFPANIRENLTPMLEQGLIRPSGYFFNKTISEYVITEKGQSYLNKNFDEDEIFNYIKQVHNPGILMDITKAHIHKLKSV